MDGIHRPGARPDSAPTETVALRTFATRAATLLFAVWTFVVLGFFSFSSRQEYYVLPALPGLALLLV